MKRKNDARSLSSEAQEKLRLRAVKKVAEGVAQSEAARILGVSRGSVNVWVSHYREGGEAALKAKQRGRPSNTRLIRGHAEAMLQIVLSQCPNENGVDFPLWTREAVQRVLEDRFGISVSRWSVNRYLADWGLRQGKPLQGLVQRDKCQSTDLLFARYRNIQEQAEREGAAVYWITLRKLGRLAEGGSYGQIGNVPDRLEGKSVLSAIKERGDFAFMVISGRLEFSHLTEFLGRLKEFAGTRIFVIDEARELYRSRRLRNWLDDQSKVVTVWLVH